MRIAFKKNRTSTNDVLVYFGHCLVGEVKMALGHGIRDDVSGRRSNKDELILNR